MLRRFINSVSGAAASEFAIVMVPTFGIILFSAYFGIINIIQQQLDSALSRAGRTLMVQSDDSANENQFRKKILCEDLVMLDCRKMEVSAEPIRSSVASYLGKPFTSSWCFGQSYDLVLLTLRYSLSGPFASFASVVFDVDKNDAYILSRSVIRREPASQKIGGAC